MITKLPYGFKDGKLVPIESVDRGLGCGCICPGCNAPLIAKKGEQKVHHFAHHNTVECFGAIETALHLAAKEVIENSNIITIPSLELFFNQVFTESDITEEYFRDYEHPKLTNLRHAGFITVIDEKKIVYDRVETETKLNDIRPDIIVYAKGKPLLIEIAVTHFVDQQKIEKIHKLGISAIEIDLSYLSDGFTHDELKEEVLNREYNRAWIFNAKMNYYINKFRYDRRKLVMSLNLENVAIIKEPDRKRKQHEDNRKALYDEGFRVIKYNYVNYGFVCPKSVHLNSKNYKSNLIIDQFRNGTYWNGTIYGNDRVGFSIYVDGEKIQVVEAFDILADSPAFAVTEMRQRLAQLRSIIHVSRKTDSDCEACPHFKKFLDDQNTEIACGYKAK